MEARRIKTLFVEDNPGDARLIMELLNDATNNPLQLVWVSTLEDALGLLAKTEFEAAIIDLNLPDSSGLETYTKIQAKSPELPIIVLTGFADDGTFATIAVKQGAQDYLVKGQVDHHLLIRAVLYAIERKSSQRKLRRLNEELERRVAERTAELSEFVTQLEHEISVRQQAERHKDDFVSMISHELRTPLSITREAVSLILDRIPGEINEKQEHVLDIARRNIDRLSRIINNLLHMSRIEQGCLKLDKREVNLCDIVRDTLASFEITVGEKKLQLKTHFTREPVLIEADVECLGEIFVNLIENAIKYTDEGSIEVAVEDRGNGMVVCRITDTGVGIPSDYLERIFNKFEQAHRATRPGVVGSGLGLAIVKNIIELHGGRISVESQPGKGSTFTFTLPRQCAAAEVQHAIAAGVSGSRV